MSAMVKRKQLNQEEVIKAQALLNKVPVRLVRVDRKKALQIALQFNIYAYDAYFIQCAIEYSCPLMTLDRRMISIAKDLNIQLLEVRL